VADPGMLIPSEVAVSSTEFEENFVSDSDNFSKDDTADQFVSSLSGVSSFARGSF
jgi:hypothetical protein